MDLFVGSCYKLFMALFDLPLEQLREYRPDVSAPADFDEFWKSTLTEAAGHDLDVRLAPVDTGLVQVEVHDVVFAGFGGHPIKAWLVKPKGVEGPLPCVVEYIGYSGGRSLPWAHTLVPAAGWAHFVMDTRGQGYGNWQPGDTGDPYGTTGPTNKGWMTQGLESPEHYYYRRVFTDAYRAVDAVKGIEGIDPDRIVVAGGSQGGGITQAVGGLRGDLAGAIIDVPFLTHFRRAVTITDAFPYQEIVEFLSGQRLREDVVFGTLNYFDGIHFAARGTAPALYSVGLMDDVCPPSTVFAAYNLWQGDKRITVWPWNKHEGGGIHVKGEHLKFLAGLR
ncbi:cephalosporin-C deacetylase [Glycomyces harbinensis]|uniref:Cephalosporin-C deacetylase n=2 Tax=Glycomyces harbinensis TaxID=58114 RepID=A0A1G6SY13_9ACTN|nr:cephalosporin-C deacetylase [Glycomyces harbinensis]